MRVSLAQCDDSHGAVRIVQQHGIDDDVFRGIESRKQLWLVHEADAGLEVVAEAAKAADVPGKVVTDLVLPLSQ